MSLQDFWPQSIDKMGRTQRTRDKKSYLLSPTNERTQDGGQGKSDVTDDLNTVQMTAIIVKENYETVQKLSTEL